MGQKQARRFYLRVATIIIIASSYFEVASYSSTELVAKKCESKKVGNYLNTSVRKLPK